MLKLSIPKEDRKPLIDLFLLDPAKREAFLEIIKDPANVPHMGDFVKHLQHMTKVNEHEAEQMILALFRIYALIDTTHETIDSLVSVFMDTFKEFDDKKVKQASDENIKSFQEFLKKMLSLHDSLGVRAKAYRLLPDQQHLFIRSEIYSDIRPVFRPDNPDIKPSAAVIIHSLKITYRESGKKQEIYLGLDSEDLQQLHDTVERGIKKHETLKTMITGCGIQCLSLEED